MKIAAASNTGRRSRRLFLFPVAVWAIWRIVQGLLVLVLGGSLVEDAFRFDGGWMLGLLQSGYDVTDPTFAAQQNPAFFPGLVWLTEPFSLVVGDRAAALIVANLCGLGAFVTVFGAFNAILGERAARRAVIGIALWPLSLVFWAFYSEGLFVGVTAAAVWADRRGKTWLAFAALVLAGTTRVVGLAAGPALAVARIARMRRVDGVAMAYVAAAPLALAPVVLMQLAQTGDGFAFLRAQAGWGREASLPWSPVLNAIADILAKLPEPAAELILNVVSVTIVGVVLVILSIRWRRSKDTWTLLAWGWVAFLVPLFTRVVTSQVRFALGVWPALGVLDLSESRLARVSRVIAAVCCAGLSVVLIQRWTHGLFIA